MRQTILERQRAALALMLLLFASFAEAQTITGALELGRKEPRPLYFDYSPVDEGLVAISQATASGRGARQIGLYKYDATLQREWQVPLYEQRDGVNLTQLRVLGDHILIFLEEEVPRERTVRLSLVEFGLDGKQRGEKRELYQTRRDRRGTSLVKYEASLDNRRLLLYSRQTLSASASNLASVMPEEADSLDEPGPLTYAYTVFDAKTDSIYQGSVDLSQPELYGRVLGARIGMQGQIYFLTAFEPERSSRAPTRYFIHRVDYRSQADAVVELPFADRTITDITFKPDVNDNLLIAGIYSLSRSDRAAGIVYARVPVDGNPTVVMSDRFSESLLARFASRARVERGKAELSDFFLDDIVLRADSGLIVVAEQYYVTSTTFRDAYGFWDSRTIYHYDDVLVVSISPEGKIEWNTIVVKQQAAERADQLSYSLFVGPEELYFFYKARTRGTSDVVMVSAIDFNGRVTGPKPFYPTFRVDDVFYRKAGQQISNTDGLLVHYQNGPRLFTITRIAF